MTTALGVEYSITPLGRSLQEPCMALARWTADNSDAVLQAQHAYDGKGSSSRQDRSESNA